MEHCLVRFDDHPIQICHEWNTARDVQEASGRQGKRPYTRDELQDLFDCPDELTYPVVTHDAASFQSSANV